MNANDVKSIVEMSHANIRVKKDLRNVLINDIPRLYKALDALGDDPALCEGQASNGEVLIQHVDLTRYYQDVGEVAALLGEAYNILGRMHNDQTCQAENAKFVMNVADNGGGGR